MTHQFELINDKTDISKIQQMLNNFDNVQFINSLKKQINVHLIKYRSWHSIFDDTHIYNYRISIYKDRYGNYDLEFARSDTWFTLPIKKKVGSVDRCIEWIKYYCKNGIN